jgi:hypothetical protein
MKTTLARMRQLIGTAADWAANDLVIGDGELAIERNGSVVLKLGDGVKRFSELESILQYLYPASGAVPRPVGERLADILSVKDFGAKGDGVTDDTAAFIAAENAAFLSGMTIFLPSGGVYLFNGSWNVRANISGYGATIKQTRPDVVASNTLSTIQLKAAGLFVEGLKVDSNLKCSGITSDGFADQVLRDCRSINALNMAFGFYGNTNSWCFNCHAKTVQYGTAAGSPGGAADGFFFGGCTRSGCLQCSADDFRRIGFTADLNGAVRCNLITMDSCVASNANNCDHSTTEYNAGFWYEGTNSGSMLNCIAFNIASGVGQASGRVTGLVLLGGGNDTRGTILMDNCRVFGGVNYMPTGISVGGSGTVVNVTISNSSVGRARIGVGCLCNIYSLKIKNLELEDVVNTSGSHGGVMIDSGGGANLLPFLEIDKIVSTNCVWHADAGVVNFFSSPTACLYTLRDVKGNVPHVMRGWVSRARIEACDIACGSTGGFGSFGATIMEFVDCNLSSRGQIYSDAIFQASALPVGCEAMFRGGSINGYPAPGWNMEVGGDSFSLRCFGLKTRQFTFSIATVGTFSNRFDACDFLQVLPATGAIRVNFNAPTKQVLTVQNSYFESAAAADTPIRLWNTAPTNTILQGNVRKTATNLTNIPGAVDTNGVLV